MHFLVNRLCVYHPLLLLFWAWATVSVTKGQNIVRNGNFDDSTSNGGAESWNTLSSNNVGTARVPDRHAGWGLSFRAPLIRPPATASQEISLDTNTIYQLSFWAIYKPSQESRCGNDENCAFVAQMRAHGDWNVNVSTTWSNFTYHSRGNGPNDVLSFVGYDDNGGTFVIDEVCLVACTDSEYCPCEAPKQSNKISLDKIHLIIAIVASSLGGIAAILAIWRFILCPPEGKRRRIIVLNRNFFNRAEDQSSQNPTRVDMEGDSNFHH